MSKKITLIIFLILFFVYLEIVFKFFLFKNFFDVSLLRIISFSISSALIIFLINNFFNKKINKITLSLFLIFFTIIYGSQFLFYKIYDSIFTLAITENANAIVEYFSFVVETLMANYIGILLLLLPIFVFFFLCKNHFNFEKQIFPAKTFLILLTILFYLLPVVTLKGSEMYSDYNLYHQVHAPFLMLPKFGLLTTMRIDVQRTIFGFDPEKDFFKTPEKVIKEEPEITIEYNTINFNWEELINNEKNGTIKKMHQYFMDEPPTEKNDYTGLFKGKNLIWIVGESFDQISIHPEATPTLYKMQTEGLDFTNFYTPNILSTLGGEYMTITGLIPISNRKLFTVVGRNDQTYSLPNLFKQVSYTAQAYHNGSATYYNRQLSHPKLGYDYYACGRNLDINCHLWPQSDFEMIEKSTGNYIDKAPFLTYYMTISGHLNYNRYGNMMVQRNWEVVKDLPYSEPVRCFIATHVELDKALKLLIQTLEENGLAEKTVIAISADHWPYGLTTDNLNEVDDIDRSDRFDRDKLPFIIWHKGIKPQKINQLGSSLDISPTLANLFGLEYDSRILIGRDILSNSDKLVIFGDRSWITEKGRYNSVEKQFIPTSEVDENYVNNINKIVYNRFYMSELILDNDYYKYLK